MEANKRFSVSLPESTYDKFRYWCDKKEMTQTEFIEDAILFRIANYNGDYDLPTLEQQRLNQLIDIIHVLSENVQSLENVTISGFDSILALTRGDNYLLEEDY